MTKASTLNDLADKVEAASGANTMNKHDDLVEAVKAAANVGYLTCAKTRHVSLGEKVSKEILATIANLPPQQAEHPSDVVEAAWQYEEQDDREVFHARLSAFKPDLNSPRIRYAAPLYKAPTNHTAKEATIQSLTERVAKLDKLEDHAFCGVFQSARPSAGGIPCAEPPICGECVCGESFSGTDADEVRSLWADHVRATLSNGETK